MRAHDDERRAGYDSPAHTTSYGNVPATTVTYRCRLSRYKVVHNGLKADRKNQRENQPRKGQILAYTQMQPKSK